MCRTFTLGFNIWADVTVQKLNCNSSCSMKPLLSWSRILKTRSISDGVFLDKPTVLKKIFGLKESFAGRINTDKTC